MFGIGGKILTDIARLIREGMVTAKACMPNEKMCDMTTVTLSDAVQAQLKDDYPEIGTLFPKNIDLNSLDGGELYFFPNDKDDADGNLGAYLLLGSVKRKDSLGWVTAIFLLDLETFEVSGKVVNRYCSGGMPGARGLSRFGPGGATFKWPKYQPSDLGFAERQITLPEVIQKLDELRRVAE